jgi:hypothetical protein
MSTGYYKTTYIGDTLIGTNLCKILDKKLYSYSPITQLDTISLPAEYTYSDADKVYIYRFNSFYTLYDFSASVGDSIIIPGTNQYSSSVCDSVGAVKVDSVGTMLINGLSLRYISVSPTPTSKWGWNARIVEKIGPLYNYNSSSFSYLFPIKLDYCGMALDEYPEGGSLRCYQDDGFLPYSAGLASDCDYIATDISEQTETGKTIFIYPNPSNGEMTISTSKPLEQNASFEVYDIAGRLVKSLPIDLSFTQVKISLNLSPGIYNYKLIGVTGRLGVGKFIITNEQ